MRFIAGNGKAGMEYNDFVFNIRQTVEQKLKISRLFVKLCEPSDKITLSVGDEIGPFNDTTITLAFLDQT